MKKIFVLAAVVAAFVACNEPTPTPQPTPEKMPIKISTTITRANDATFDNGDKVGIYVVNYNGSTAGTLGNSGNHVNNMQFTYNNNQWTAATEIYWLDKTTKTDFYAYYPYGTPTNVNSYAFATKADQSSEANYWASDFLWGKAAGIAPTEYAVPITTKHVLSNILVYLVAGEGFTAETLAAATKTVKINNVKTAAQIDLATGVATATGNVTTVTAWNTGEYYRAMIVPQTVADGTNLVTVTIDGVDYVLASGMTFAANKQHKCTVTVNKSSGGVNIGIGGWETDENEYGGDAE